MCPILNPASSVLVTLGDEFCDDFQFDPFMSASANELQAKIATLEAELVAERTALEEANKALRALRMRSVRVRRTSGGASAEAVGVI
jgi:hypothetical protein